MDSPDARRLRQARREARKRNINQNAADRLRRIQGVQSSGATVTRPEVENRESQEANSGDISVTRPGSSETANTNVDEASAAGAGLIEETQRNDNDRRIPEGGLAATGATADGSEDGSILKRRIVRKPDTNDESQSLEKQHESMAIKSSSAEIGQAEQSSSRHAAEASGAAGTEKDKSSTSSSLASQSQSSENNAAKQDKAVRCVLVFLSEFLLCQRCVVGVCCGHYRCLYFHTGMGCVHVNCSFFCQVRGFFEIYVYTVEDEKLYS
eukprot:scpid81793/ scgid2972/ 